MYLYLCKFLRLNCRIRTISCTYWINIALSRSGSLSLRNVKTRLSKVCNVVPSRNCTESPLWWQTVVPFPNGYYHVGIPLEGPVFDFCRVLQQISYLHCLLRVQSEHNYLSALLAGVLRQLQSNLYHKQIVASRHPELWDEPGIDPARKLEEWQQYICCDQWILMLFLQLLKSGLQQLFAERLFRCSVTRTVSPG